MKKQDNQEDYTFLRPLNDDPEAVPDPQFIKNLRNDLISKANIKSRRMTWFDGSLTAVLIATVFFISLFLLMDNSDHIPSNDLRTSEPNIDLPVIETNEEKKENIMILEEEKIEKLFTLKYGDGVEAIGQPLVMHGGGEFTPTSFFVKDNLFYILDNKDKKVVVTYEKEHQLTIPLHDADFKDIYVDEEGNIYVFDHIKVIKLDKDGSLLEEYTVPDSSIIFTSITGNAENEPIVYETDGRGLNLIDGKTEDVRKEYNGTFAHVEVQNNFEGAQIILEEQNVETEIDIPYEHSYIRLLIHDINAEQIIFEKVEKSQVNSESESHMYVIDKSGSILGAVRVPDDETVYYSNQRIRVENNQIYFMSADSEEVSIYSLTPGKIYEKKLRER